MWHLASSNSDISALIKLYPLRVLLPILSRLIPQALLQPIMKQKKRNEKTRQQYKKKAQAQAQRVTIQEMEQSYGQEVEHLDVQIGVKQMASKHVFLQYI